MEGVSSEEWQNLTSGGSVQGADTAILIYPSIEACSEGLYRCVITNAVGKITSECAVHIIGEFKWVVQLSVGHELHVDLQPYSDNTFWFSACYNVPISGLHFMQVKSGSCVMSLMN